MNVGKKGVDPDTGMTLRKVKGLFGRVVLEGLFME